MSNNPFKKLAGQTAIYGLGTMVPRLLNYLLVPLYTRVFVPEVYGQHTVLYAYIAFLLALLTYGMETTFFRHGKGEQFSKVYGNIMTSILATTLLFVVALVALLPAVADATGFGDVSIYVLFTGLVVAADAIAAVPFCLLRQQNQAKRFSLLKIVNVSVNIALNIFILLVKPETATQWANNWFGPQAGLLTWVFISNLIACLVTLLMLWPQLRLIRLQWDGKLMRRLLGYAIPILFINIIGMVNEVADKLILQAMLPDEIATRQVGIYGANYKLAVLMTIFVQMFRFACEPFFFARAEEKNSPKLFADIMTLFVICGLAIFLCITLFLDLFGYILSNSGSAYREGLGIVPIVLFANLMYGIVYNLGMWYKLSDRTLAGTVITAIGAAVTLLCLILLIPVIGYWGAACAHFGCYFVMMIVSYVWGQKVYPIPYNIKRIAAYTLLAVALFALGFFLRPANPWLMYSLNTLYLFIFLFIAYKKDIGPALRS